LDPSQINGSNLNNIRREASRHFTNKKREYLKDKINGLTTNSKKKHIRGMYRRLNEFKKGYQLRNYLVNEFSGSIKVGKFLSSCATGSFSRRARLHGYS
jgi:hypothetical protein